MVRILLDESLTEGQQKVVGVFGNAGVRGDCVGLIRGGEGGGGLGLGGGGTE